MNLPPLEELINPLTSVNIRNHQRQDTHLYQAVLRFEKEYPIYEVSGVRIVCRRSDTSTAEWKIVIPSSLIHEVIHWYHIILGHCGIQRLYDTINSCLPFAETVFVP